MNPVLPTSSTIYQHLDQLARSARIILFAGLPGVGKSLYLQQQALIAHQQGRSIHLLQWDVTRTAFERPDILARYPEVDGVTHPAIRKAVGLWARGGLDNWQQAYPDAKHLLIGEVPLMGNRLIELAQQHDDRCEALLGSTACQFVVPVPSTLVKAHINKARASTIAKPQHARERADAPPNVLLQLWQELHQLALALKLTTKNHSQDYNPEVYAAVYSYLLKHRHHQILAIHEVYPKVGSVYDLEVVQSELKADDTEVNRILQEIEQNFSADALEQSVSRWHEL